MQEAVVKELNAFLKEQYMGIHAYEEYIQNINDDPIKKELQKIQQDHKQHAQKVAMRIQNLGGKPVDSVGFTGAIQETIGKIKGYSHDTKEILRDVLKGEDYYGIRLSEEIVKGDLDPESKKIIETILDKDRKHVDTLNNLLQ